MKAIKIIGHPVLLMSLFLLLIIEGDQFGGLYLLYLVLALPQGAPYAIAALCGLAFVFAGYKVYRTRKHFLKPVFYLTGFLFMLISLIVFFSKGNKWETFGLTIPLLSFIIFGVSSVCFILNSLTLFMHNGDGKKHLLNPV